MVSGISRRCTYRNKNKSIHLVTIERCANAAAMQQAKAANEDGKRERSNRERQTKAAELALRRFGCVDCPVAYRNSCSTLACDWLASASAETAIDWRVESAWLLAASWFGSARTRFEAPVCSTLTRLLLKSWRICTIERFEPSAEASARSVLLAELSVLSTLLAELLSRKSLPWVSCESPMPPALKMTPWMFSVDRPVSLNTRFSVSPFSRLMPLNEESCAVVLICASRLLYCATRLARVACEVGSATGAPPVRPVNGDVPVIAPIVEDAALFVVCRVIAPVGLMLACRLLAASAALSWLSVEIWPLPKPKVRLVIVPPPVGCTVSVSLTRPPPGGCADNPSLASALPESVRPAGEGVSVMAPFVMVAEAFDEASISASRSPTLSPMPIEVPEEELVAAKVKVVPLTTSVSAVVRPVARSFEVDAAAPDSRVVLVIATGVTVALVLTALPTTGVVAAPSRFVDVALVSATEVTLDLVS